MGTFQILLTALLFFPVLRATTVQPSPFVRNGEPTNITVMEGSFASFSCLLTHMLPYSIDWMFNLSYVTTNGSLKVVDISKYNISTVGPTKGETLFVKNVAKTDEGFYRCVVSVNGRSISNSTDGYLKVILKPTLRHVPSNQTVVEGDNVTLHCQLENFDPQYFFVSWFWNEINISRNYEKSDEPKFTDKYNIQGNRSLEFAFDLQVWNVSRNSTGYFNCRVYSTSNHELLVQSYPVYVNVLFPPESKYPVCEPSNLKEYYRDGEMINTTCTVKGGKGPMFLQWVIGPNPSIENIAHSEGHDRMDFRVKKSWSLTSKDDGSSIICSLTGDALSKEQKCSFGPLNVHYNPIVSIFMNASRVNIGENVIFMCSIKSNPLTNATDYQWFVNDVTVSSWEKFMIAEHGDQSVLTIYNVTEVDENSTISCGHAGIDGSSNASTILRLQTPSATPETLTSVPVFTYLSRRTSSSTHTTVQHFSGTRTRRTSSSTGTTVQHFNGARTRPNTLHFFIVPVVVLIVVVILGILRVCKKIDSRQRASEPSKGNMELMEQELQLAGPFKFEDVETKAECDVHAESPFISVSGEQLNINKLGEMNTPERKTCTL
ncbi:cell adhesion molecule 2-like [Ptychodera flava]|uniref:cell adhesion molecule 2-like n=1 Tax=Ptychodera flava TaxID=63121 RepID=UPI00396A3E64